MKRGPHFELSPDLTYEDYVLDEAIKQTDHLRTIKNLLGWLVAILAFFVAFILLAVLTSVAR